MIKSNTRARLACAAIATLAACTARASASVVVDNFNEYTNGQEIASSSTSTPWERFGSVNDGLYATTSATYALLDGSQTAQIPLGLAASTGNSGTATIARDYTTAAPVDYSANNSASIEAKSVSTTGDIGIEFYVFDGNTSYVSTTPQTLTQTAQLFTFAVDPADLTLGQGSQSLATVLSTASAIGVKFVNLTPTLTVTDHVAVDNFTLSAVPEPTSAALLGVGLVGGLLRRKH